MIVATAVQVVASVAVGILATGCVRNMVQTASIARSSLSLPSSPPTFPSEVYESTEIMVQYLQTLSREELLQLFCNCPPPTSTMDNPNEESKLCRAWNGILLNNNNLGMTSIGSKFMSNILFGKGRRWNGKSFDLEGKGINRFAVGSTMTMTTTTTTTNDNKSEEEGEVEVEHIFDYTIGDSRILTGTPSIILNYSKYQGYLSLWRTMTDEVRSIPGSEVFIGFGAMAWSGGMLNSAPFCLFPAKSSSID